MSSWSSTAGRAFREEFEPLEPQINAIAAQGLSYGIHLMLAASRWAEIRPVVKDQIGTRLELRLGDPARLRNGPPRRGIRAGRAARAAV